jgi:dTDP-4-amino-4,6-dideoxygalactose transaminase
MDLHIPLSDIDYGPEEEEAVLDVLHRRWLTMGTVTQAFEAEFAAAAGARHALAVSNGTHALHLACLSLGLGPGDEVIVPALTFVATANAVLYTGAQVHFAEILGPEELNLSPEAVEQNLTPRTKAILVVHYGGYPCRMAEILAIAGRHGLAVIEDAAHAHGASLAGRALGTWGDIGCFSFFSNKNLATGEGGMLLTDRDDLADRLRLLRSHGMTTLTWDRHRGHAYSYDVVALGNNYRIDEIRSALGRVQLGKLARNNARRRAITARYRAGLADPDFAGLAVPFAAGPGEPSCHILPVLLPEDADRRAFMDAMRGRGIQTSIHYPPVHQFSYYRERHPGLSLPVTEAAAAREVTLPLYPSLTDDAVDEVIAAAAQALAAARREVKQLNL